MAENNLTRSESLYDRMIADVLNEEYREVKLRTRVRNSSLLKERSVGSIVDTSANIEDFIQACRALPQFGELQEKRIRIVLDDLRTRLESRSIPFQPVNRVAQGAGLDSSERHQAPVGDGEAVTFSGKFYPDFIAAWQATYLKSWRQAHLNAFIYIPMSIPEFVKHPEVLRAEIGQNANISAYLTQTGGLRSSLSAMQAATGLILVDRTRLELILDRRGPYADVTDSALFDQIQLLSGLIAMLPPSVEIKVCDIEAARQSSCSIVGDLVTIAAMGGYIVTQDRQLAALLVQRCTEIERNGQTLEEYLIAITGRQ
jgi:hypothetical protein